MGVLFDYLRAADDAAAVDLMDKVGDGPAIARNSGAVDAVDLKGIDPVVILGKLVSLARGVPWDVDLVATEGLWSRHEQELMSIDDTTRDTLASISSAQAPQLSIQWGQIEELAWNGPLPDDQMLPFINDIAGLARRARDAGDHLYCWLCL